jgi:TRAP-type mannitol/chloroaromatic compound transport system permease small subunit
MRKIIRVIDTVNDRVGLAIRWLSILALGVICMEVFMRYGLNHPTSIFPVVATMTMASMYTLSFGYVHLNRRHIRVDVLYLHVPNSAKITIDVVCAVLFLLPLLGLLCYAGWNWVWYAIKTGEQSLQSYWYPKTWPVRTAMFLGFCLFSLQGLATLYRDMYSLVRHKEL